MEWFNIIGFLVLGLILIIIELVFIPGTTVVGILGFIAAGAGIYFAFEIDQATGIMVASIGLSIYIGFIIYAFKAKLWTRFSLKKTIDSNARPDIGDQLSIGDEGKTQSMLRPFGKAEFKNKNYEVCSEGEYINHDILIKIIKINRNKIIVAPINN